MTAFNPDGSEVVPPGDGDMVRVGELGGQFDRCAFWIEFTHESLNHAAITAGLALTPIRAWNAGERHSVGDGRSGRTRVDTYGRWATKVDVASGRGISDALAEFFGLSEIAPHVWRKFSLPWSGRLALVGHARNWNREFTLQTQVVAAIAERGLAINIDAYFDGEKPDGVKGLFN